MADNISSEHYRAEISMLNREIARLNKEIQRASSSHEIKQTRYDPFNNPAEYAEFRDDYSVILPQIEEPGYTVPLEPASAERKKLRRFYSIGAFMILFHFLFSEFGMRLLIMAVQIAVGTYNKGVDDTLIINYMKSSSIFAGLNLLIFMTVNVLFGFIGLKMTKTDTVHLVRTYDFSAGKAVEYCICALTLWTASVLFGVFVSDIFSKYGYDTNVIDLDGVATSPLGSAIMIIYTCVIAPVTEEFFFRGMLLRVFGRANQRFAVFATAIFFGLSHGNLSQFILAFIVGVFLAHITLLHGSIIPSVIVHIFINTFSTLYQYIARIHSREILMVLGIAGLGVLLLGILLLLMFNAKHKLPATTPAQSRRGAAVAFQSIPMLLVAFAETGYILYLIYLNMKK
ncbi:MAG: CPBP family intramembrane metalloprotease [Ruminococcus sp.]|nr:CPBP family intramembrane metalloprotease [Ruminococcus sp.]